jgi:hypothetical protein
MRKTYAVDVLLCHWQPQILQACSNCMDIQWDRADNNLIVSPRASNSNTNFFRKPCLELNTSLQVNIGRLLNHKCLCRRMLPYLDGAGSLTEPFETGIVDQIAPGLGVSIHPSQAGRYWFMRRRIWLL